MNTKVSESRSSNKFELFYDGMFYGIGQASQRAIALICLPFFIHYINPSDYGVVGLLSSLSIFLIPIFSLGLNFSTGVCYFNSKKKERADVISSALFISSISAGFFLIGTIFFIDELSRLFFSTLEYKLHTLVAFITIFFSILCIPIQLYQQYTKQSVPFLIFALLSSFFSVIVSFLAIVLMGYGALGLLIGAMVGQIFLFLLLIFSNYKLFSFTSIKNVSIIYELIRFGIPMIPSFFLLFLIQNAMRWSLQFTDSLDAVGIFSFGASIGAIVNIAASGFTAAWLPWVLDKKDDWESSKNKIGESLLSYFTYGSLIIALFFIFAQLFIKLIAPPLFFQAWLVIGLVASSHFFISLWYMTLPPLYIEKRLSLSLIAQVVASSITIVSIFFMTNIGILGAGLAIFLGSLSLPICQYFINKKLCFKKAIPINIFEYCKTFLFLLLIAIASYATNINELNHYVPMVLVLFSLVIIYCYIFNNIILGDIKHIILNIGTSLKIFSNSEEASIIKTKWTK